MNVFRSKLKSVRVLAFFSLRPDVYLLPPTRSAYAANIFNPKYGISSGKPLRKPMQLPASPPHRPPPSQSRSYRVYQMPCITGALSLLLMECLFITAPFVPLLTAFLYLDLLACNCRGKGLHLKFHELSRKDTVLYPSTIEIGEPKRKADSAIQYLCTCIQLHAKSRPALNLGIPKSKYVCLSYSKPRSNKNLSRLLFFSPLIVIEAVSSLDGYVV